MPPAAESEAKDSRTTSVGVKRRLPREIGKSSQPQPKKRRRTARNQRKRQQELVAEKYGFVSVEHKLSLLSGKDKKKVHQAERRRLFLLSKDAQQEIQGDEQKQSTAMNSSHLQNRSGAMAWNNGHAGKIRTSLQAKVPETDSKLGSNRLAIGFMASAAAAPSPDSLESGETHSTPIEISSDEEESEGGMEINVDGQATPEIVNLDSDEDEEDSDEDMEDGGNNHATRFTSSPEFGDPEAHIQVQTELGKHLSNNFGPLSIHSNKKPVRLADLSARALEQQYKYCFYGLARDQIDLSRPAICIECLQEGHTDSTCPAKHCTLCGNENDHMRRKCPIIRRCTKCRERGHDAENCEAKLKASIVCEYCGSTQHIESGCALRFFPLIKATSDANIKLWISCCACASKTHLVGDCPSLHPDQAPRWSLRTLDPQQISNMSLQTGITGLEKAAENRGMRPQGRDIRPAKQRPQRKTLDDESDDTFIRPPVPRQQTSRGNINFAPPPPQIRDRDSYPPQRRSPDRYDRYDAPSGPDNRSRGDWYNTDSFGQRRRSRSPDQAYGSKRDYGAGDSYRPYDQPPAQRRSGAMLPPGDPRYRRDGRYDQVAPVNRNWQPPLPAGSPPGSGSSSRPGAGLPARPPTGVGQGQRGRYR